MLHDAVSCTEAMIDVGPIIYFICHHHILKNVKCMQDACHIQQAHYSMRLLQGLVLICMSRPVSNVVKIETQSDWGYSLGTSEWKGATGHIAGKEVQPLSKP